MISIEKISLQTTKALANITGQNGTEKVPEE